MEQGHARQGYIKGRRISKGRGSWKGRGRTLICGTLISHMAAGVMDGHVEWN